MVARGEVPIVVDGATGFVGSNFAAHAAAVGRRVVVLARDDPRRAERTVRQAVAFSDDAGVAAPAHPVRAVAFHMDAPDLGLDQREISRIFDEPCDYWHFAANTSLAPIAMGELQETNVGGTRRTVELFERHAKPGSRYFLVSTVYACGLIDRPAPEDWFPEAPLSAFRTYYEATKRTAENIVRDAVVRGLAGAVMRLGQVVGTSTTGRTTYSYGFYDFLSALRRLLERHPAEYIRIAGAPDATLNLVPVDWCARWLWRIATTDATRVDPPIFHVVARDGVPVGAVCEAIGAHLDVELEVVPPEQFEHRPRTLLERLLAARMAYMGEYISQRLEFDRSHMRAAIGDGDGVVDLPLLHRLIARFLADRPD